MDYEANYLSGLAELSQGLKQLMRGGFVQIISQVLNLVTEGNMTSDQTVHAVNALNWNYTEDDVEWLAEEDLLAKLLKGNAYVLATWGTDNNPYQIRVAAEKSLALQSFVW